jgi:signal transduction histidine kinase
MPDQELELVARGLAHDLNNVLSEILGHASLLETGTLEKAEVQESAEAIHRAAKRASEIASRLANLSLVDGRPKVPTDVNALAREVAALLRATLPEGIRLAEDLRAKHPLVIPARCTKFC